jgi:F-type H+-transporting ATPase subunit a
VNPLEAQIVGHLGPVPITRAVVTTWALLAALALVCIIATRRLSSRPGRWQTLLEVVIVWIEGQIRDVIRREPGRFLPLLGTLLVFLLVANLSSLIPGVTPPTARIETAAALVLIVFVAIRWYGIREIGLWRHLKSYAQPHPIALPLNIIGEITRTFALMIRLFGNVMSGHFLVVVIVALAGFPGADPADGPRRDHRRVAGLHLLHPRRRLHRRRARRRRADFVRNGRRGPARPNNNNDPRRVMTIEMISIICASAAMAIGAIGPAFAEGKAVATALESIARQPEASGTISRTLFVGLAMIETTAIYCLVIALLLMFANPYV